MNEQVNPPYHCPMIELVPAPWTSEKTRAEARSIIQSVGHVPVSLTKELPGFILNRIQYTLLNECWRLVRILVTLSVGFKIRRQLININQWHGNKAKLRFGDMVDK